LNTNNISGVITDEDSSWYTSIYTQNYPFVAPVSANYFVTCVGGGGGGVYVSDGANSNTFCSAGGGSGYVTYRTIPINKGESINVNVGIGGNGVCSTNNCCKVNGSNGGVTSFGQYLKADGGEYAQCLLSKGNTISSFINSRGGNGSGGGGVYYNNTVFAYLTIASGDQGTGNGGFAYRKTGSEWAKPMDGVNTLTDEYSSHYFRGSAKAGNVLGGGGGGFGGDGVSIQGGGGGGYGNSNYGKGGSNGGNGYDGCVVIRWLKNEG
jgi:hypothetical protein